MFIDSINNYLSRFPRLRTDPKYRSQTREIMVAARDYINDVEGVIIPKKESTPRVMKK